VFPYQVGRWAPLIVEHDGRIAKATLEEEMARQTTTLAIVQRTEAARKFKIHPLEELTLKVSSEQTNRAYCILELRAAPNAAPPLHVHRGEDEIFEILDGQFVFFLGGHVVDASAGTTVVVPRDMPHTWRNIGQNQGLMTLTFVPGGIDDLFKAMEDIPNNDPRVAQLAEEYGTLILGPPMNVEDASIPYRE
jgi:mannose-6-phosphate isomerase-like protein (cupin superfamily)